MEFVEGVVQHYAWGDLTAIPALLGVPADGTPWAEWWLGTHPGGPAHLANGRLLEEVSGRLPYLLKVLAAAEPLSLQTHPDAATAAAGFARENAAGIALDAPNRVYRDPFAKPELICALTEFDALCGFRPMADTIALLRRLGADELAETLQRDGLAATVAGLYRGTIPSAPTVAACAGRPEREASLVTRLDGMYPGEPSVVVTLLLNRVTLQPGDALYLDPGNLHAYLHGVGVEVMGASDNVVRGGLTVKHVDVDELLSVLSFEPLADPIVVVDGDADGGALYPTPGAPFELHRLDLTRQRTLTSQAHELLLCTAGSAGQLRAGQCVYLAPGESIPLTGPSTVFRVTTDGNRS